MSFITSRPTIYKISSQDLELTQHPPELNGSELKMVGGGGQGGGGSGGTAGQAGFDTTFGTSLLIANGGSGHRKCSRSSRSGRFLTINSPAVGWGVAGGGGGSGYGGNINIDQTISGAGGNSFFGGGGKGGQGCGNSATAGAANTGGGGGGQACANSAMGGGGGAGGYIEAIINNPNSTYSYILLELVVLLEAAMLEARV
jgi:hypothetical protein